jgi:predicted glycoside hydrolase/deacetylase ChbG (UPF0249 family)
MIMLELIINADDLGLTAGCNAGIIRAMLTGVVTDTTLMINTVHADAAVKALKDNNINQVGLHLNLTYGPPVLSVASVPSLVNGTGKFHRKIAQSIGGINLEEAERELRAQLARFLTTGLGLTHLDSHHHAHSYPGLLDIAIKLAKEQGVPLRQTGNEVKAKIKAAGVATTDSICLDFYDSGASKDNLQKILAGHQAGVLEIMCHPAREDEEINIISSYNTCRSRELAILTDEEIKDYIRKRNIELVNFTALQV